MLKNETIKILLLLGAIITGYTIYELRLDTSWDNMVFTLSCIFWGWVLSIVAVGLFINFREWDARTYPKG